MRNERLKGLIGLAARSGQAVFGETACRKLAESGKCGLILLSLEASENTGERYEVLCAKTGTGLARMDAELPRAAGRDCMAIGLREGTLCGQILRLLRDDGAEDGRD